jgi:hypothetical protein
LERPRVPFNGGPGSGVVIVASQLGKQHLDPGYGGDRRDLFPDLHLIEVVEQGRHGVIEPPVEVLGI